MNPSKKPWYLLSTLLVVCFVAMHGYAVSACCSLLFAEFNNTVGFVSEIEKDGKTVHVLAYQNVAQNKSSGGNAMFLPIPAKKGTMSEKNIVDTKGFGGFMDDMEQTVNKPIIDPMVWYCCGFAVLMIAGGIAISRFINGTVWKALGLLAIFFAVSIIAIGAIAVGIVAISSMPSSRSTANDSPKFGDAWNENKSGSLTPQSTSNANSTGEATVVMGVNTAGVQRVNKVANFQAMLKIFANAFEIYGIVVGLIFIVYAVKVKHCDFEGLKLPRSTRAFLGVSLIVSGLICPGILNWLTAGARDANLFDGGPIVFNHGIYTIVLADDASQIPSALEKVPENKRPAMNKEIFDAYQKWYNGWTFALCCFDTKDAAKGSPLVWWYEPEYPDLMFFPALDAHDGKPPILKTDVQVDHCLIVSSHKAEQWQDPLHWLIMPWHDFECPRGTDTEKLIIPTRILGRNYEGRMAQGDFVMKTADVRRGILEPIRALPPGADEAKSIWSESKAHGDANVSSRISESFGSHGFMWH